MRPRTPKQYFYFRQDEPADQGLYRLLMRHKPAARTKLFRDLVRQGFRQYLKKQRARKESTNGSTLQKQEPVSTIVPPRALDQPWK